MARYLLDLFMFVSLSIFVITMVGAWQWPFRGVRVGEASDLGAPNLLREGIATSDPAIDAVIEDCFSMPADLILDDTQRESDGGGTPPGTHFGAAFEFVD